MLSFWVQQNHDGLPQKAGFPQWLLNEIHGSWCLGRVAGARLRVNRELVRCLADALSRLRGCFFRGLAGPS